MIQRRRFISVLLAGFIVSGLIGALAWSQGQKPQQKPQQIIPVEVNLVMEEMAALDEAFKTIIDALILGEMKLVKPALADVHEAAEGLTKAIKAKQKITLPKNQAQFNEFVKLDEQFHANLEALGKAAEAEKKQTVLEITHKLLDGCVICHEKFRK